MPVLPKGELEVLLEAAIDLSKKGRNTLTKYQSCICDTSNSMFHFQSCTSKRCTAAFFCNRQPYKHILTTILGFFFIIINFAVAIFCKFHKLIIIYVVLSGLDVKCEACQRFFRDGLTISFTKILTDEAVSGWKFEIHVSSLSFSV